MKKQPLAAAGSTESNRASLIIRLLALVLFVGAASQAQLSPGKWNTDLSKKSIDLVELQRGGPPKDGIPSIDNPRFVPIEQAAAWLDPKEPVLAVNIRGESRAYPIQILIWHELVNDRIGEIPILVSYCPLCNSAIVFDRRIEGKVYNFGVSGMLRYSDMVMYDRQTDSLWQQLTGDAIVGTMTGRKMELLPSQVVSFTTFARSSPAGAVLSRETGHHRAYGQNPYNGYEFGNRLLFPVPSRHSTRIRPMERLVTVELGKTTRAYPFSTLRSRRVVEDRIEGVRFVVLFEEGTLTALDQREIARSRDIGAAGIFHSELDGRRLSFRHKYGKIVDRETGSAWNAIGAATEGPLAGKRLTPIPHGTYFAFAWLAFRPDTQIVGDPPVFVEPRLLP